MSKTSRLILIGLFGLAILLRFSLALVNRQANDDHMEVVHLILQNGSLPTQPDCWECYQPKLFHFSAALLIRALAIGDPNAQIVAAQLLNVMVGSTMLWFVWLFIRQLPVADDTGKLLAFGLVALNPGLVGINIQATNDTFAITFSALALYWAYQLFERPKFRPADLALASVFAALAVLSKSNTIVTALAIFCACVLKAFFERDFSLRIGQAYLPRAALFAVLTAGLVLVTPLGQYVENYQRFGSPVLLTINTSPRPLPALFQKTDTYQAGILSIQDGFFTFKWLDLLANPQVTTGNTVEQDSRTSFWTILYGRAYFLQYIAYPSSWVTKRPEVFVIGRLIYVLALLPTALLLLGLGIELVRFVRSILRPHLPAQAPQGAGLLVIAALGYLGFLILYALEYRMYSVIKAIFIFPAIPAFVLAFLVGFEGLSRFAAARKWLEPALAWAMSLLLGLYVLDISSLLIQLAFFR